MRLAGQVKMGYYPTPADVVRRLKRFLSFPEYGKTGALDPCCGEGTALHDLTDAENCTSYGIELDAKRAEEATGRLDKVFHTGYEQMEVPPEGMGLLFLNPPYDDGEGERKELTFLRDTMPALVRDGILVYIIPARRLTPDIASLLAANFTGLQVYRFPDQDYEAFKQIVVLGRRNLWPVDPTQGARTLLDAASEEHIKVLPEPSIPHYRVPNSPEAFLHKREVTTEELERLLAKSPLWERLNSLVEPRELGEVEYPPTPLHVGHLGLLLAAGRLNGVVGKGADRHIVVGKPEKHVVESEESEEDADGNEFTIKKRLETFRVAIKILRPTGELRKLA